MGMPHPIADWTVAQVLELPDDGNRYEVVDGERLVSPAPSLPHQEAVQAVYQRVRPLVDTHQLGRVLLSPADIEFDERTLVQPDLFVAPLVDGRRPRSWKDIRTLLLAVEVLSPTTARADRHVKGSTSPHRWGSMPNPSTRTRRSPSTRRRMLNRAKDELRKVFHREASR